MTKITTKAYGEITVEDRQIFEFPEGILGFDYIKKFAFIDADDDKSPFKWLQAIEEPDLAFVIISPVDFLHSYELHIAQAEYEAINAKKSDELLVYAIVTIPDNPSEMTANLQGPIILNPKNNTGRQAISISDKYHVKHKILDEMSKNGKQEG